MLATTYLFNSMIFAIIFWSAIKRSGNFTNLLNTHWFNSLKNQYLKWNFSSFEACKNFSRLAIHSSGKLFTLIFHTLHVSHQTLLICLIQWAETDTVTVKMLTLELLSYNWAECRLLTLSPGPRVLDVGRQAHGASWRPDPARHGLADTRKITLDTSE